MPKSIKVLEKKITRQAMEIMRLQNEVNVLKNAGKDRLRRRQDNQAYALGLAVECADRRGWARSGAFEGWLRRHLHGWDLNIALRGVEIPEALPDRTRHARRFRWGRVFAASIACGDMPAEEAGELVRQCLDGSRLSCALLAISEALSPTSINNAEPSRPPSAAAEGPESLPGVAAGPVTHPRASTLNE
jgi:hypothetical protein